MNRDSEDIQRQLLMLLQDLLPIASSIDAEAANRALGCEAMERSTLDQPSLRMPNDVNSSTSGHSESKRFSRRDSVFELGDVPAVQDRFHALLKHRLQSEIQQNPPLFPWETEIRDYETGTAYGVVEASASSETRLPVSSSNSPRWVWIRHLSAIDLPIQVPQPVLTQLLERCQTVVQSSLREGAKLVQAVEELFPGQADALNYLAGLVMTSPARSDRTATLSASNPNFPSSYEAAVPAQQMVLSLLAAREIIDALTLTVSANHPVVERQWETDFGTLTVQAVYEAEPIARIRVQANLPCEGSLTLKGGEQPSVIEHPAAGSLNVELPEPQLNQASAIAIQLKGSDQAPLTFAVRWIEA
ncbi:MAG: PatU [Leptolyngbyaceae cyanobacterium RU_5_1]|nr:PatU [Leptolyngbyaceae cyanobacterium RU_5_1]